MREVMRMEPADELDWIESRREQEEARLPHCWNCGDPIRYGAHIKRDMWICPACIEDMMEEVEDE